jgi:hypothetical protein
MEDEEGRVWVGVHFGSRGFGHKTALSFLALAQGLPIDGKASEGEMEPVAGRGADPTSQALGLPNPRLRPRPRRQGREAGSRRLAGGPGPVTTSRASCSSAAERTRRRRCTSACRTFLAAHGDSIRVKHRLRPLGVAMAGRDVYDPYKD